MLLIVGLLCVPAMTRVHQQLDGSDHTARTTSYSRHGECPTDELAAIPVALVVAGTTDDVVAEERVPPSVHVPLSSPDDTSPDALRAPPVR